jgi:hypothetical protein
VSTLFFSPLRIVGGTAVGVGVGQSVADAIAPLTRQLANETWSRHLSMPISAVEAASVVASGERDMGWGLTEAGNSGVNEDRFRALVDMLDTAPDLSTLFDLLHRGFISEGDFREGARKSFIEDKWIDALIRLAERVLSPAEAANAWQQGFMDEAAASHEAELSGVSPQRSAIQRQLAGLPPGAMDALVLLRRGHIDEATYRQIVREGHVKTKYTDALLALRNRILSAADWANLWLRGWVTEQEAKAGGARDGYGPKEMELLYLNRGRPATVRQAHIGFARGGRLPGAANEEETLRRSVQQSNIRTEWFDLLYAQRYTYPSAFVIRALTQEGTFDRATSERILIESGWNPEYARLAAEAWSGAGAGAPKMRWAERARSRLFTSAHNDYMDGNADEADARALLAPLGLAPSEADTVLALWNLERARSRRDLTQAQILKLVKKGIWPAAQGQTALEDLGMDAGDAADLLTAL